MEIMDPILTVAGVILLILNIALISKFFQIARNIERLTDLYVDGCKRETNTSSVEYYKLPLEGDVKKNNRIKKTEQEREAKIERMKNQYKNPE